MEGPGWAGRFRGQLDLPGRFRGQYEEGFGVDTTCYETHEILVLEGFGVFRGLSTSLATYSPEVSGSFVVFRGQIK